MGPTRRPTSPTSRLGSLCSAKTSSTPFSHPPSMISCAPPGMTSSAGWKISRTPRPADASAVGLGREGQAGTQDDGRMQVVAAGVGDAFGGRRPRQGGPLGDREGVEVGAQGDPVCGFRGPRCPRPRRSPPAGWGAGPAAVSRSATTRLVRVSRRASSGCA